MARKCAFYLNVWSLPAMFDTIFSVVCTIPLQSEQSYYDFGMIAISRDILVRVVGNKHCLDCKHGRQSPCTCLKLPDEELIASQK